MEVGDLSEPYESTDHNQKACYKILMLKARTGPLTSYEPPFPDMCPDIDYYLRYDNK